MTEQKSTDSNNSKPIPTKEERELHYQKRLQKMGEWLLHNRTALLAVQSVVCSAMCDWCEDESPDADGTALYRMNDTLDLYVEIIAKLRNTNFCPDHTD